MKKPFVLYLLIIPFIISSCDFLEKFDHFGVGNTFEESFEIGIPAGAGGSFAESVEFSVSDDATISDNIEHIQEFEVNRLSLKVTKYDNGDPNVIVNGILTVRSNGFDVGETIVIENLNLSQLYDNDEEVVLLLSDNHLNDIKEAYLGGTPLTFVASGDVSESTTDVVAEITIYMSIDATISN